MPDEGQTRAILEVLGHLATSDDDVLNAVQERRLGFALGVVRAE